ncbi:hypothetical protein IZ6_05900 [Terrihabitans soli]|uniref:Uncharacterized protein n=1 Tax=Terrihabitans soli TaxID=708113 RepID=A0A6S6QQ22_9HYPH|nr:hypothetical protein [Terrihabitans soli]BCJ89855.1 hypothetical protein IZ6_05900 [Terrihabitans soli]
MPHKFRIGDAVDLAQNRLNTPRGPYKITSLMPEGRDGEPQYRIKSDAPGPERVVTEVEIVPRARSATFSA